MEPVDFNNEVLDQQPIIFEEIFAIDDDSNFVKMVKQSSELTEAKIFESLNLVQKSFLKVY